MQAPSEPVFHQALSSSFLEARDLIWDHPLTCMLHSEEWKWEGVREGGKERERNLDFVSPHLILCTLVNLSEDEFHPLPTCS